MDKAKAMKRFCLSFVKNTSDSEEHGLPSTHVMPGPSTGSCTSVPLSFSGEPNLCSEDGWIVEWDPYSSPCVFEILDYLRYYHILNRDLRKATEVFQSESQRQPQVSPGNVKKDKDREEPDQPSPSLLREKGLELETCDGGDCPDQDPASDSPRCLGCWAWLPGAFAQKKKKKRKKYPELCLETRNTDAF